MSNNDLLAISGAETGAERSNQPATSTSSRSRRVRTPSHFVSGSGDFVQIPEDAPRSRVSRSSSQRATSGLKSSQLISLFGQKMSLPKQFRERQFFFRSPLGDHHCLAASHAAIANSPSTQDNRNARAESGVNLVLS